MSTDPSPQLGQDAVTPPTRDLGSLLAPRARRGQQVVPDSAPAAARPEQENSLPTADPDDAPGGPGEWKHQSAEDPDASPRPASAAADAHLRVSRVVYLADDLVAEVGAACARDRLTRTQLVLHALEATHRQLGDLVAQDLEPRVIHGTLFDEVVTTHRQNQPAKRQVMIQPTRTQLEVIDKLVKDSGARDRSHLVAVALAAHLGRP